MSFVFATPGALATATTDLASIGSTLSAASAAAAGSTTALPAAADEVSAAVAATAPAGGRWGWR
jgi:PE family